MALSNIVVWNRIFILSTLKNIDSNPKKSKGTPVIISFVKRDVITIFVPHCRVVLLLYITPNYKWASMKKYYLLENN